jgi:hypothetical protein
MASSSIEINTAVLDGQESVPNISKRLIRKLSTPTEEPTPIEEATHTNPFLPTCLMMDIIHMMPLEKIVEVYEAGGQRIPVKTMARLLEGKLTFPTQLDSYPTGVSKSFAVGKYRIAYEEHGENCMDGTFSHSFTDYTTSFYDGNHRFYMHNFRKSSKQRLDFNLPFGGLGVTQNEPEIERTTEEYWDTYPAPEMIEGMLNLSINGSDYASGLPRPRASPFSMPI